MPRRVFTILSCVILFAACSQGVDPKKFEDLYRVGKSIEGATAVGVTYQQFGELLQKLATEIAIGTDKAKSEKEKELVRAYSEVLAAYRDSTAIWKKKIEQVQYGFIPKGKILIDKLELLRIIEKYGLPLESEKGLEYTPEDSIQEIWGKARKRLEQANEILAAK